MNKRSEKDSYLELAIQQGYVPKGCTLNGQLVLFLTNSQGDPCKGCNMDRKLCGGRPKE